MKKVLKIMLSILPLIIICSVFVLTYYMGYFSDGNKKTSDSKKNRYKSCEVYIEKGVYPNYEGYKQEYLDRFEPWNYCEKLLNTYDHIDDSAFTVLNDVYRDCDSLLLYLITFLAVIPVICKCSKEFKAKHIKSVILREKYSKYITKLILNAYKSIWFIPVVLILNFAFCYLVTGHIDIKYEQEELGFNYSYFYSLGFYITYFLTNILYMLVNINLALIVLSRNKNVIISFLETLIISSFVSYNIEMAGARLLDLGVVSSESYFWSLNVLIPSFYSEQNLYLYSLIPFITFILTFIVVIAAYTNKERLIQMCEK